MLKTIQSEHVQHATTSAQSEIDELIQKVCDFLLFYFIFLLFPEETPIKRME
jgi:hypothetical protein